MIENELVSKVELTSLLCKPLNEWRDILLNECQVYISEEGFLAKRFNQINFKYCSKEAAKEMLVDNIYALLKYKYFKTSSEDVDAQIKHIADYCIQNIGTSLKHITINENVEYLPDYCIAFKNGVYDFKNNDWFMKYNIYPLANLNTNIYEYDAHYIINWYFNYDFEPLPINITDKANSLNTFVDMIKEITKTDQNYCFELLYNMAHDRCHTFTIQRFEHLCQILGYTLLQSFSQHFVMLIGSGQNGKNSLFDGCFTYRLRPYPSAIDLETIESDTFVTGTLSNKSHNIFLETDANTITKSKVIKALTGSMFQSIHEKGVPKYNGIINCKYIFAGNDKDKIKFSDTTTGFTRRINLFEIFYQWDSKKAFMKKGDYYNTTFSDSLKELTSNVANTTMYIYLGMYGIMSATEHFTRNFKFTYNEWGDRFSDIDFSLKDTIADITPIDFANVYNANEDRFAIFDEFKKPLTRSSTMTSVGLTCSMQDILNMLKDDELSHAYFSNYDIYISMRFMQKILHNMSTPTSFTQNFKKTFALQNIEYLYGNKPYIKCRLSTGRLQIIPT